MRFTATLQAGLETDITFVGGNFSSPPMGKRNENDMNQDRRRVQGEKANCFNFTKFGFAYGLEDELY